MPDYQKMYHILSNEVSKAIDILQQAQAVTEEYYLTSAEAPVHVLRDNDRKSTEN